MTQHTPGPWKYEPATQTIRADPANYWIATVDSWDGAVDSPTNARLIASSPELADALEDLITVGASLGFNSWPGDTGHEYREAVERGLAALDKARER